MANDVTMPTNVPISNTEYIDGLLSSSWLHVVIMLFSLARKVQQLHVQEDGYANITAPLIQVSKSPVHKRITQNTNKNLPDKCLMDNVHILLFLLSAHDLINT